MASTLCVSAGQWGCEVMGVWGNGGAGQRGMGDVPWKLENEDVYRWVMLQGRVSQSASVQDAQGGRASA
jgi:hypothetical protein